MTVSQYINYFFTNKGIKYIFGFQGSAMLKIVHDMETCGEMKYIQLFHEQSAAFAADAIARVSGMPGVAIATSGPGAINMLAGVADCYFDSIPSIFITGQYDSKYVLSRKNARQNGFQDMDIVSVSSPITKSSRMLEKANDIAYELEYAWHITQTGRKGPALVDIPLDLQFAEIDTEQLVHYSESVETKVYDLSSLRDSLKIAKRPLIIAGGGIRLSGAEKELFQFSQENSIPVATTLMGVDLSSEYMGFGGLYGFSDTNIAIRKADLLIVCGARMGVRHAAKRLSDYTNAKVFHIDIDKTELRRVFKDEITIEGDVKEVLAQFNALKEEYNDYSIWNSELKALRNEIHNRIYINEDPDPIRITEQLLDYAGAPKIVTADVGQNQMWVAQAFAADGESRLLNSGGYGSMGFSLPAAIGASFATPRRKVLAFTGDGGFHMNQQELLFLQIHQLDIKCIVFNNGCLGLMREAQDRYYNKIYVGNNNSSFRCVDLERLAETYSLQYVRIEKFDEVIKAKSIIENDKPALIEIKLENNPQVINRYDEMVFLKDKCE